MIIVNKNSYRVLILFIILFLFVFSLQFASAANITINSTSADGIKKGLDDSSIDNIILNPGTYTGVNNTGLTINKNITIQGNGSPGTVVIDAELSGRRIFTITGGVNVIFENITFTRGDNGAIWHSDYNLDTTMTFKNCTFTNNTSIRYASSYGACIHFLYGAKLTVMDCNFTDNIGGFGGFGGAAIYSSAQDFSVIDSNFINNNGTNTAGAIFSTSYNLTIRNSTFINNTAEYSGGAIYVQFGNKCVIENSNFINNTAKYHGGAIYFQDHSNCTIINSNFTNNAVGNDYNGGAIYCWRDQLTVIGSTFTNNSGKSGGAIYSHNLIYSIEYFDFSAEIIISLNVINSSFINNIATANGGAIYGALINASDREVISSLIFYNSVIVESNFTNNKAINGSAIYTGQGLNYTISNSTFKDNIAIDTGTIYNRGSMNVSGNIMAGNLAKLAHMIYNNGFMGVLNLTFINNSTINVFGMTTYTVYANLTDDCGNTVTGQIVTFIINGYIMATRTVIEGYASYDCLINFEGIVPVTGGYSGHGNFLIEIFNGQLKNSIDTNTTIIVPDTVKIPASADEGDSFNITGVLADADGGFLANTNIDIIIANETFSVFTDDFGIWRLLYTPKHLGTITVSVKYAGDNKYSSCENSTRFTVTKDDIDILNEDTKIHNLKNSSGMKINGDNPYVNDFIAENSKVSDYEKVNISKTSVASAAMKNTGMPLIVIILVVLLSNLRLIIYRKK